MRSEGEKGRGRKGESYLKEDCECSEFPGHEHSCKQKKKKKKKERKKRYYKINNLNVWSIKIIILAQSIFHKALSGLKVIFDTDTRAKHLKCTIIPNFLFLQKTFLFKSQCVFSSCLLHSTVWSKDSQGTKYILIRTLGAGISEIQLYQTDAIPGSDSFI